MLTAQSSSLCKHIGSYWNKLSTAGSMLRGNLVQRSGPCKKSQMPCKKAHSSSRGFWNPHGKKKKPKPSIKKKQCANFMKFPLFETIQELEALKLMLCGSSRWLSFKKNIDAPARFHGERFNPKWPYLN